MKNLYKATYLTQRFFQILIVFVLLFIVSFFFERLLDYIVIGFFLFLALLIIDFILLYGKKNSVLAQRVLPDKFSNGDQNPIEVTLRNRYPFKAHFKVIDELPVQFQERNFNMQVCLDRGIDHTLTYTARPLERGEFNFGSLNVFSKSGIGLIWRKSIFDQDAMVPNYPSFSTDAQV